ncbi:hypothetical protein BJV74DRAFT_881178 [Russula compacta]|nr:hypothetical protein BJV74DRAFT_881178 [Russula compacta]
MDLSYEGLVMREKTIDVPGDSGGERNQRRVTIDILPDDVFLEVFFFYQDLNPSDLSWWQSLVHVCRRWRFTILESPLRLRLILVCNHSTPVGKSLNIWPPIPIAIHRFSFSDEGSENIIAAFEHHNRVREIDLVLKERFGTVIQQPFPALTYLRLVATNNTVLHEEFLGGSAPSLRTVILDGTSFRALPHLLLTAAHLVTLQLLSVPITGYISPESMAACLATLLNLEHLRIEFQSPRSRSFSTNPLSIRAVLPALTSFRFQGASSYLEDLISRIDTPILDTLSMTFSNLIFHIPQLSGFISRIESFKPPNQAVVYVYASSVYLKCVPSDGFKLDITCAGWVSSMARVCRHLSPFLSGVECLVLHGKRLPSQRVRQHALDRTRWLALFRSFIGVRSLYVSMKLVSFVASALQELTGERTTAALPELHSLFLEELRQSRSVQKAVEPFVAARQLSGLPVAIQQWQSGDGDDDRS